MRRQSIVSTRAEATIDDLYRVPEHDKAELVNGEIVLMPRSGVLAGIAGLGIAASLLAHERKTKSGHALPDNVGFVVDLPHRKSFCPDAACHVGPVSMGFI